MTMTKTTTKTQTKCLKNPTDAIFLKSWWSKYDDRYLTLVILFTPWLPCSGHTISSTGPSVSPFRDFFAIGTKRCPGLVPTPHLTGEKASFGGVLHSFVSQLTLLYNLWDSFLYHTICGTAQAQAILFYKTISVTLIHCLRAFSLYTISFHVLSILYAYVGMRFVTVIKHSVFAEFTIIEAMCFLSSKCFICSAPLKKQLRCLTQMRFAVKHSSPFPGVLSNYQAFI